MCLWFVVNYNVQFRTRTVKNDYSSTPSIPFYQSSWRNLQEPRRRTLVNTYYYNFTYITLELTPTEERQYMQTYQYGRIGREVIHLIHLGDVERQLRRNLSKNLKRLAYKNGGSSQHTVVFYLIIICCSHLFSTCSKNMSLCRYSPLMMSTWRGLIQYRCKCDLI